MDAAAQLFNNATASAQLSLFPTFSNKPDEDKFTAAQWLEKVINNRAGTTWTDEQMITHVRNAFRGELLEWFDSLTICGVDITVWANIKEQFEKDYHAAPSTSSIVHKIPDIKQGDNETVVQYFNKALKTVNELKSKINSANFVTPPFVLVDGQAGYNGLADYNALPAATKAALALHYKQDTANQTLNNVAVVLITAGLKPDLKAEVLKRDNLFTIMQIRDVAFKAETLNKEKFMQAPTKPNGNGSSFPTSINEVSSYRGKKPNRGLARGGQTYSHHDHNQAVSKHSSNNPPTQQGGSSSGRGRGQQTRGGQSQVISTSKWQERYCDFCEKQGHITANCWALTEFKAAKAENKKVDQIDKENVREEEFFEDSESEPVTSIFTSRQTSKNW